MWEITGGGLFHWRKRYYGLWLWLWLWTSLMLKCIKDGFVSYKQSFLLHKTLTDGLEWCGFFLWIIVMFLISCLDSHSDGTHSLQRIQWWASDVMLHIAKSVSIMKQTHLHTGSSEGEYTDSTFSFLGELFLQDFLVQPTPARPPKQHKSA